MLAKVCSRPFLICISRAAIALDELRESAASNKRTVIDVAMIKNPTPTTGH